MKTRDIIYTIIGTAIVVATFGPVVAGLVALGCVLYLSYRNTHNTPGQS